MSCLTQSQSVLVCVKIKKDSCLCSGKDDKEKEKVKLVSVSLCYCEPGLLQLEPARLIKLTQSTLYDSRKRVIWVVTSVSGCV